MSKITTVIKRSGAVVPFTPERITNAIYRAAVAVGGRDRDTAEGLSRQVVEILEDRFGKDNPPSIEDIQDAAEKVLIENGHAKVAKAYILYRDERERNRQRRADKAGHPHSNIPFPKIWKTLDWAVEHGVHTVKGLNDRIARGEFSRIVAESERAYEEDVENAAELIIARKDALKLVIVTGPSSSGKTTSTTKVAMRLERVGLKLVVLNIDHYFFNLEDHPKDEFGDYDFETPQALDLEMINDHLVRLFKGEEVLLPFYDFKTGQRSLNHTPMQLKENEIILIDSLHGLYAGMTKDVPDEQKFKLFLEPLLQMKDNNGRFVRWTDLRLIRRMLRDATHRAYDPTKTLLHWHYVRSSEMRNIIPYINTADYIINSGMPYELPLYKARLFDEFTKWVEEYEGDPLREDAYARAKRVHALLETITAVEDDSAVPSDSVLREFIGGSSLEY